jgi:hypothetical protein
MVDTWVKLHIQMLASILGFSRIQLLASKSLMQFINNAKMTRLQFEFQVMIVMNVPFMMHYIVAGIEVEM